MKTQSQTSCQANIQNIFSCNQTCSISVALPLWKHDKRNKNILPPTSMMNLNYTMVLTDAVL